MSESVFSGDQSAPDGLGSAARPAPLEAAHCLECRTWHPWCPVHHSLACAEVWRFLVEREDLDAAMAQLPPRPPARHVAYVPRPGYRRLGTSRLPRLPVAVTVLRVGAWTVTARHDGIGTC